MLVSTLWVCPGGWLSRFVPYPVKPFVCQASPKVEFFYDEDKALGALKDKGYNGGTLVKCNASECQALNVDWNPEIK